MKVIVIGNSIVRGLEDPTFETICLPGTNWYGILKYVTENIIHLSNSFIYIHIGPVRFTRLHQTSSRRECALVRADMEPITVLVSSCRRKLRQHNIRIVFCTLYPMDFIQYNKHLQSKSNGRLMLQGLYHEYNIDIKEMVDEENKNIVDYNISNNMATPYCHKRIFTRRHSAYAFRNRFLYDGLHPKNIILKDWIKEIKRVHALNSRRV